MIARVVLALVIAFLVGLGCVGLLGPILVSLKVPIAIVVGNFFVQWGWEIGVAAGLWYAFLGYRRWHF